MKRYRRGLTKTIKGHDHRLYGSYLMPVTFPRIRIQTKGE